MIIRLSDTFIYEGKHYGPGVVEIADEGIARALQAREQAITTNTLAPKVDVAPTVSPEDEKSIFQLQEHNSMLQQENDGLKADNTSLDGQMADLKQRYNDAWNDLTGRHDAVVAERDTLKSQVDTLTQSNGDLSNEVESLKQQIAQMSTSPKTSEVDDNDQASDLPDDFPGKVALLAAGYKSKDQVKAMDKATLTQIPGVGDATAQKILEYQD